MEKVNILLVDDQPAKLLSFEVILEELGENLLKAGSARAALEILLKTEVAVVLTDVSMPETDGFELAAMIREHPRFRRTAIIFVSAIHLTDPDRLRGYQAGAVDYLPVPLVPELMRAKVKVFAELYRKTRELERLNAELENRVAERTRELAQTNAQLEQRVEERTREREAALAKVHEMQKMESIGQLTGGVAHDFNNLLTAVSANLELLRKRIPDNPALHRLIDGALAGASRGASLTRRMLAFARRQELKPAPVHLQTLLEGMSDMVRRSLGPQIDVSIDIAPGLPSVMVDPHQLELAILNLALNARDAMDGEGQLTISAEREATANPLSGLSSGAYVSITVTDTGTGMDEATLKRATEPFFTTKGVGKGTGLGLSMVQGLMMQSGGAMQIDSRMGQGTSIRLWLPMGDVMHLDAPRTITVSKPSSPISRQILLVDDDPLVLTSSAAMLEDLGHRVATAESGMAALQLLATGLEVELLIADYAMPGMNGLELSATARHQRPGLPIIIASGFAEQTSAEGQPFQRLAKPYLQSELAACIEEAWRSKEIFPVSGAENHRFSRDVVLDVPAALAGQASRT
ncbi:response regulator [Acidisphaera sp. S103]|uniref:response regulator n=1 Tax=Acidisphaera sp. S103 TaxID=1747223 RepID=UPI00131EB16A|nr:response regulator [Acidisphaera sp. S103]